MKNTLALIAVLILLTVGVYYSVRNARHPADDPALSSLVKAAPVVKSICVTPIQNLSHKPVAMEGVDDELVSQLHKVGFESRKISDGASQCDATTNAEVVDITGRGRKTARVDFRLTLTSEQVPRISSSVEGKSGGKADPLEKSMSEFAVNPDPKESLGAEREAIVAALGKTAAQIDAANKRGLPPWQAKEQ
jgi:hypothetical protein